MRSESYQHIATTLLLILIAVNLLILDLKVFSGSAQLSQISTSTLTPTPHPEGTSPSVNSCPDSCISLINKSFSQKPSPSPSLILASPKNTVREYYIPLGSGSTQSNNWDDQTSTDTVIDPSNYGNIKEVYFIATLKNPTQNGNVIADLYNVTDKHPVWNSEINMNGPAVQTVTSGKITLDTGAKLYRVQLKSGLQAPVSFDTAKIRILTE